VELLLLRDLGDGSWLALARPSRKLRAGERLFVSDAGARIVADRPVGAGEWIVRLDEPTSMAAFLARSGELPLPPYIRSAAPPDDRYQTVYADREGSVAAPTAGLHFTPELLDALRANRVETHFVTLHVGPGTFRPVKVHNVQEHVMHAEWGEVPAEVAAAVNRARSERRRVVAVGTTTTRLLETASEDGRLRAWSGMTELFIYPGYRFSAVDALITNFHLPQSTLLMLVSAFAGRETVLAAYAEAVRQRYRFFSFGDAMLIV
jgi:S-adenosylmethionine:tRNA ribosyltransferase-isomerase